MNTPSGRRPGERNTTFVSIANLLLLLLISSAAWAQSSLFIPASEQSDHDAAAAQATKITSVAKDHVQRFVALNIVDMQAMKPGDETTITTPSNITYPVVYERTEAGFAGGKVWVGYLRDFGKNYPVFISTYAGQVSGSMVTPSGKLRLQGTEQRSLLTDLNASNERAYVPRSDDTVRAPTIHSLTQSDISHTAMPATSGSPAEIDLLWLFSPSLQTSLGGYSATIARANQLVAIANTVYTNSGINISLVLVSAQVYNGSYVDDIDSTALPDLQSDATVAAMRDLYGADLVTLARPFVEANGICGLAYIPSDFSSASSAYGFSVIEDGSQQVGDETYYCDVTTMTHELGHNMGAAHDVYAAVTYGGTLNGVPSYNRGYCNGNATTVMAYEEDASTGAGCPGPNIVYYFSNPSLTTSCGGGSCGVADTTSYMAPGTTTTVTGADSTSAINLNAPSIATWRPAPTKYSPLTPARLLDTRAGKPTYDGLFAGAGALGPGATSNLTVVGRGGVPDVSVGSVVLNVTAVNPSAAGFVTVWPTSSGSPPLASNLNFTPGETIPNLVIVKVGTGGLVSLFNSAGNTHLIADVAGWFPTASGFTSLTPARLLDTRSGKTTTDGEFNGTGAYTAGEKRNLTVLNRGNIPLTGVGAVVLNVTAVNPTAPGYVTVWPAGSTAPLASNLNFTPGETIPNLVISAVGTGGQVTLFNSVGSTQLVVDAEGYFATTSELTSVGPARLLDTRPGGTTIDGQSQKTGALGAGAQLDLTVTNRAGIPSSGVGAVVLNVTADAPTAASFITVWPSDETRPLASNLNVTPGQIIPNLVIAKVSSTGKVSIYNNAGSTQVIADVFGWFPATP